jgi:hypothetical protein
MATTSPDTRLQESDLQTNTSVRIGFCGSPLSGNQSWPLSKLFQSNKQMIFQKYGKVFWEVSSMGGAPQFPMAPCQSVHQWRHYTSTKGLGVEWQAVAENGTANGHQKLGK